MVVPVDPPAYDRPGFIQRLEPRQPDALLLHRAEQALNIHFDQVDWQRLVEHVRETPLTRALYTQPLTELLARLDNTDLLRSIIAKANNPYWLVKELASHTGLLGQWEAA